MGRLRGIKYLAVIGLAVAMLFAFASLAFADQRNPECLTCHSSMSDWTVTDVDRDTACAKCHTPGLMGTHPIHNTGANCGAFCHIGYGTSTMYATPSWLGPQGSFASSESANTSSADLHVIHSKSGWMATNPGSSALAGECGSCHEAAACSACHSNAPSANHSVHSSSGNASYTAQPAWTGMMANGVVGGDLFMKTATNSTNQCATAGCHDIAGSAARIPVAAESDFFTAAPALWKSHLSQMHSGQQARFTNKIGYSLTGSFSGDAFELVGPKDPYYGKSEIWIDGAYEATIDQYDATTKYQQVLFSKKGLTNGTHNVQIVVLGQSRPEARGAFVFVDTIFAYGNLPASVAPKCDSCHPDKTAAHGTTFSHEASAAAFVSGSYAGFACNQCHDKKMIDEHRRTSSKTSAGSACQGCHTVYAPYTGPELSTPKYDYTCTWNGVAGTPGCHNNTANASKTTTLQAPHQFKETTHTVTGIPAAQECIDCHGNDLGVIHDDTNASRPQHASLVGSGSVGPNFTTNCLTCHGATKFPATKSCLDSSCHTGSGVVSMATHPSPAHTATDTNPGVLRTKGTTTTSANYGCSACHFVAGAQDAADEHFKGSSLTSVSGTIGCNSCHSATYFPVGWKTPPANTCISCHPVAGGEAGAPHEAADYNSKHNFNAYGTNLNSCGSGNAAWCHATNLVDVVHDDSVVGNAMGNPDCDTCHSASAVPTAVTCIGAGCHVASGAADKNTTAHVMTKHVAPSSTECVECHEQGGDVRLIHASCEQCHANPTYPGITIGKTTQCTSCHTTGGPGGVYTPHDPNHYTGTESTHTASAQSGTVSGFACSQCHSLEMKPAHSGPTTVTFSLGGYSDKCVACHELRVDALGTWNKTCDACHATKHGSQAAKHDASTTALSGPVSVSTIFTDGFESASWPATWATGGTNPTYWRTTNTTKTAGTYAAEFYADSTTRRTAYFQRVGLNLSTLTSPTLAFSYNATGLASPDYYAVQYSTNGSTWNSIIPSSTAVTGGWVSTTTPLPSGAASVTVRFWATVNATTEFVRYDAVTVSGQVTGASPGTALTACGDTGCHDVTAADQLHENSVLASTSADASRCATCHKNASTSPVLDCYASGCHSAAVTHATITGDDATHTAGSVQASDTAYQATQCSACHSMQLTVEHTATTSVKSIDPANTCKNCHKNSASSAAIAGGWSTNKNLTTACSQCHTGGLARHSDASATAHSLANAGCGATGPGCHPTTNIASVGVPTTTTAIHNNCLNCHDRASANASWTAGLIGTGQTIRYSTATKACGQGTGCHVASSYSTSTANHRIGRGDQITGNDATHTTNAAYMASTVTSGSATNVCTDCHLGTLASEHATTSAGNIGCTTGGSQGAGCHNTIAGSVAASSAAVVKSNWNGKSGKCSDCHSTGQHNAIGSSHTATGTAGCASTVTGCHPTSDLVTLHKNRAGGGGCQLTGCHDAANKSQRPAKKSCGTGGTCHTGYTGNLHGGSVNGNDTTHTALASTMNSDTTLGSYTTGGGNTCSACHSSGLTSAHTTVTARLDSGNTSWGAAPYCTKCHGTGTGGSPTGPDDAITVIKTDSWGAKSCDQCHVTRGNGKHASYNTSHTASLGTSGVADGCAGASCHVTTDVRAVHNVNHVTYNEGCTVRSSGSASTSDSALACHDIDKSMRNAAGALTTPMSCGQGSGGCHTNHNNTNHGGAHTLNVAGSNYTTATITGCTNAGSGCHGYDSNANYQQYHPTSGCTGGLCHTAANHNNTAFNDPNTCQNCHGGGAVDYNNAPIVSVLTTTTGANRGHFNETSHTAGSMTATVSGGTTGTVSWTCNQCHNSNPSTGLKGLYGQHQGLGASQVSTSSYTNLACSECHNYNVSVTSVVSTKWGTKTCVACHAAGVIGAAYAQHGSVATTVTATEYASGTAVAGTCAKAGCHATANLHWLHKGDASSGTTITTQGCGIPGCHDSTKQGVKPTSKSCGIGGTCHNVGDPHGAVHYAPSSTACVDCHETNNVQTLHAAKGDGCNVCHGGSGYTDLTPPGRTTACLNCHDGVIVGTHTYTGRNNTSAHYTSNATTHTSTAVANGTTETVTTSTVPGWGNMTAANACSECHSFDMWAEHNSGTATFTVVPGTYADKCVACHEYKVDSLGAAWNKSCAACHTSRHTGWSTKHNWSAQTTVNTSCGTPTTDCHDLADVAKIHSYDENGDGDRSDAGEAKCESCHVDNATRANPAKTCTDATCHGGTGTWYNPANRTTHLTFHETSNTASVADGNTYSRTTVGLDPQCQICHNKNIQSDHATLTLDAHDSTPHNGANTAYNTFVGSGDTNKCAPCHFKASASTSPSVVATAVRQAIATDKQNCASCHANTTEPTSTPGYYAMHIDHGQPSLGTTYSEFTNRYSGHRSFSWMRGVVNTQAVPAQTTYSWAWPTVNVFVTTMTLDGAALSTTSMVHCDDCHGVMVAGGPHGGSIDVTMAAGFKTDYTTVGLTNSTSGMSSASVICAKCHDLYNTNWSNSAHAYNKHWDNTAPATKCVTCHIQVPHAWKRPRLLRKTGDPAAYTFSTSSVLSGMVLKNYTLSTNTVNLLESDCNGCSQHTGATSWP